MIGMNDLGLNGRLGNQMFQYAALIGIAVQNNHEYCIPNHNMSIKECFNLNSTTNFGYINGAIVTQPHYHFCSEIFNQCPDNVTLHGHFESEKYFANVKNRIKQDFTFKPEIMEEASIFIKQFNNPVAIVIRRGDFLKFPHHHPICEINYYVECLSYFDEKREFIIISDDIEWCKNQTIFTKSNFNLINVSNKIQKAYYDLCVISLCSDFIISNSTFAWWGSWLSSNNNKKIYAPTPWFGKAYENFDTTDLYPNNFIKIERNL